MTANTDREPAEETRPPAGSRKRLPRTQTDQVLEFLRTQGPLTQPEAQDRLGCFRLGARIWDLKQRGHAIRTDFVELPSGQRVAQYSLVRAARRGGARSAADQPSRREVA